VRLARFRKNAICKTFRLTFSRGFDTLPDMNNTKSDYIGVRLFPEDLERVTTLAKELGTTPSRLVRLMIHFTSPRLGPVGIASKFRAWARRVLERPLFG
jgi:hypothetical protein